MKDRLKQVRKDKKVTQQAMANALNVSKSTIEAYEYGRAELTNRSISDICRIYGVSETWLRTGIGSMYEPRTRADEIAEMATDLMKDSNDPLKAKFIKAISKLSDEQMEHIIDVAKILLEETSL